MVDVLELASYILYLNAKEASADGDEAASDMTPMKLQKLLYYCQGYSLGTTGRPLFNDPIVAWKYGPVVKRVYKEYQVYKKTCLPLDLIKICPVADDYMTSIVSRVINDMGKYSATELSKKTHSEPAWKEAWSKSDADDPYPGESLSLDTMKGFFIDKLDDEMTREEENKLWDSIGQEPTVEEWKEIAEWAASV